MRECCVECYSNEGEFFVTSAQMDVARAAGGGRGSAKQEQLDYAGRSGVHMHVCAKHAISVVRPHVKEPVRAATSKVAQPRREFVHDILVATGTHEHSPAQEKTPQRQPPRLAIRNPFRNEREARRNGHAEIHVVLHHFQSASERDARARRPLRRARA